MTRALLILFIGAGILAGCESNKKRPSSFNRHHKKTVVYKPAANPPTSSLQKTNTAPPSDTIPKDENIILPRRPKPNFQGAEGPGTGGSYASSSYRQDELNRKKYERRAMAELKERKRIMDSLHIEIDSTDYNWR